MFFLNSQHEVNYKLTLMQWEGAEFDPEHHAACYLLSVPIVFEHVVDELEEHDTPVDWILKWEEQRDDSFSIEAVELGRLSLHLWNGCGRFHFLQCLEALYETYFPVVQTAFDLRMKQR